MKIWMFCKKQKREGVEVCYAAKWGIVVTCSWDIPHTHKLFFGIQMLHLLQVYER